MGGINTASAKIIEIIDLSVRYGEILALDGISLEVEQGDFVLVTGVSGCGKSTLARVIAGLIPGTIPAEISGRVRIDGLECGQDMLPDLAGKVGIVFQNPVTQLFHLRVDEEVAFGPRNLGLEPGEVEARVAWAYSRNAP